MVSLFVACLQPGTLAKADSGYGFQTPIVVCAGRLLGPFLLLFLGMFVVALCYGHADFCGPYLGAVVGQGKG